MHVCMIVPNKAVRGGIASVVNGYRGSELEERCRVTYIESYQDGSRWDKLRKALKGYVAFCQAASERPSGFGAYPFVLRTELLPENTVYLFEPVRKNSGCESYSRSGV